MCTAQTSIVEASYGEGMKHSMIFHIRHGNSLFLPESLFQRRCNYTTIVCNNVSQLLVGEMVNNIILVKTLISGEKEIFKHIQEI